MGAVSVTGVPSGVPSTLWGGVPDPSPVVSRPRPAACVKPSRYLSWDVPVVEPGQDGTDTHPLGGVVPS
jgi:hypothetical protein